jgi:minor extracellular serine protease Vpr
MSKVNSFSVRFMMRAALPLAVLGASLQSCTPSSNEERDSDESAYSNRPQSYNRFIAIIKLSNPALLTTAKKVNGKTEVNAALRDRIKSEQEKFIAKLKASIPGVEVLYSYKLVLNGIAVSAPIEYKDKIKAFSGVSSVESESTFERPRTIAASPLEALGLANLGNIKETNSASYIGAHKVHSELGATGKGVRVGVLDTGVDYTHAMLGGVGTEEAYKANNPDIVEPQSYPNKKVVGGIDLVGTTYNSASPNFADHIPKPDNNPIDEAGHGSHVAGTIAGTGDGVETYDGVAPDAQIYAIKVFGKEGSTGDAVIIAGLEFAADPNNDLDPADQLDLVNLSLGSEFGTPHLLYSEALKNLVEGGTVAVCSAGNSGHNQFIVGAPSTSPEAISVAASIDNMPHNWKFRAVSFATPSQPEIVTEAVEAAISKPIADAGDVIGKLVYLGFADADFTEEQKAAVKGHVAFIDRGKVAFADKIRRAAEAGAIGVVVANNVDGDPFGMGGDGEFNIPAIMITKSLGATFQVELTKGDVTIDFQTDKIIDKPELIDNLTGFSSRGPRSNDALIKPEVSAPGSDIISAKVGGGKLGTKMSGTSMAAPHVAGVVALLKQLYKNAPSSTIKSLVVNTAKSITDKDKKTYPVSQMGAGRVQAYEAATAKLIVTPQTLSLGVLQTGTVKVLHHTLTIDNLDFSSRTLRVEFVSSTGLTIQGKDTLQISGKGQKTLPLTFEVDTSKLEGTFNELDGMVRLISGQGSDEKIVAQVPVLALSSKITEISATATKEQGNQTALTFANKSQTKGDAYLFNLLAVDEKTKQKPGKKNPFADNSCDLETVGYRFLTKKIEDVDVNLLQFAVKLNKPVTSWHLCDLSVLIDANNDGVAEQELLGTYLQTLSGNAAGVQAFGSFLTDAAKMRDLRKEYEGAFTPADGLKSDYSSAILDGQDTLAFDNSSVAIISADWSKIAKTPNGFVRFRMGALANVEANAETDDFLGKGDNNWFLINPDQVPYSGLPEAITVEAGQSTSVKVTNTQKGDLAIFFPHNLGQKSSSSADKQAQIVKYSKIPSFLTLN